MKIIKLHRLNTIPLIIPIYQITAIRPSSPNEIEIVYNDGVLRHGFLAEIEDGTERR